jgi:hypothetical protein
MTVTNDGTVYLTGQTTSEDLPTTAGAIDSTYNGNGDSFVASLSNGNTLNESTYLGGSNSDIGNGVGVDGAGNILVAGATLSADFPSTPDADDPSHNGGQDGFLTKIVAETQTSREVMIDVRPFSRLNTVNISTNGFLPVAILASEDFDPRTVDESSITIGDPNLSGRASPVGALRYDVNRDGRRDFVLIFAIDDLVSSGAIALSSTSLKLTGTTLDGQSIFGSDTVRVIRTQLDD